MISYEEFMKKEERERFHYFLQVIYRAAGQQNMNKQSRKEYLASLGMKEITNFYNIDDYYEIYNNIVKLYEIGNNRIQKEKELKKAKTNALRQKNILKQENLECSKNQIECIVSLKSKTNFSSIRVPKHWLYVMGFDEYNKKAIIEFYNDEIIIKKVKSPGEFRTNLSEIQSFLKNNNINYEYLDKVHNDYTCGTIELKSNTTNIISIEEILNKYRRVVGITIFYKDKSSQKLNKLILSSEHDVINLLQSELQEI